MKRFIGTALGACLLLALVVSSGHALENWPYATANQSSADRIDLLGIGAAGAQSACAANEDGTNETVVTSARPIFGGYINGYTMVIPPTCTLQFNAYSNADCTGDLLFQDFINVPGCVSTVPPAGPGGEQASPLSPTEVLVSWVDMSDNEDGFKVYYCKQGTNCNPNPTILGATVGPNVMEATVSGLIPAMDYFFRACAFNAGGEACSNNAAATTFGPPTAPNGIAADPLSATENQVSWNDNSSTEDGFKIFYCIVTVNCDSGPNQLAGMVGPNTTSFNHTGLLPMTQYRYKSCSFNAAGQSCSGTDDATTFGPPAAPGGIGAVAISPTEIKVSWNDNSNNEDGFNIYFCRVTAPNDCDGTDPTQLAGSVGPNQTMFTHTGRKPEVEYRYKSCSFNAGGEACSGTDSATTPAIPSPTDLIVQALSSSQIELQWKDNSDDEDGFNIYRCQGMGCTDFFFIMTVPANTTNYIDEGLMGGTFYRYEVTALINPESAPSNRAGTTTLVGGPALAQQTGQIMCYSDSGSGDIPISCSDAAAIGQDGQTLAGVPWPSPRFELDADVCKDGGSNGLYFLDKLTNLCYLANPCGCFGGSGAGGGQRDWYTQVSEGAMVCDPSVDASCLCGLDDGSAPGDWRVAQFFEAVSLLDFQNLGNGGAGNPGLPDELIDLLTNDTNTLGCWDQPFWTSTTAFAGDTTLSPPYNLAWQPGWQSPSVTGGPTFNTKTTAAAALLVKDP